MSETKSGEVERETSEAINWDAVAKALGVARETLPVCSTSKREVETVDVVRQVAPLKVTSEIEGYRLADDEWAIIEPLIPRLPGPGSPNDRAFLCCVLFRQRAKGSGKQWAAAPEAQTIPLKTLQGRFQRWFMRGWWEEFSAALEQTALSERRKQDFRHIAAESVQRRAAVNGLRGF